MSNSIESNDIRPTRLPRVKLIFKIKLIVWCNARLAKVGNLAIEIVPFAKVPNDDANIMKCQ